MATKTAAGRTAAPRKARPATRKSVKAKTPSATPAPATQPRLRRTPALKAPSPIKVVKTVAKAIEASPVGKAGAVTSAVLRSRRAAQLSRRVRNKHVVVTGASSGIGLDCALKLGAAGATVMLAARTPSKLQETVERIRADGGKAFAYACDLSDMADCDRFIQTVLDEHGHVDILINNAGRSIRRSVKASFDRFHDFERTMQLNYFGALRLIFGFAPKMLERKSGHIINISSIGVLASPPRFSAYVASKAALDAFSWCAAPEFADANVRFTTINMPLVRTPMIAPTRLYDALPALSPDAAAEMVMSAVIDKPKRVATGLGLTGAVAQAVAPGLSEFVLNQAFRLFPDSAAARGAGDAEGEPAPRSPTDLARKLFAQVFSGVHWKRRGRA
jgi:NAD(P)-dependent dehydrogenase (short-subunit alcohol dehydrogenase family)